MMGDGEEGKGGAEEKEGDRRDGERRVRGGKQKREERRREKDDIISPNSKGQTAFTDTHGALFILTLQVGINPYIALIKTFCKSKPLGQSVCFS